VDSLPDYAVILRAIVSRSYSKKFRSYSRTGPAPPGNPCRGEPLA
jgi:hypothetical protein